MSIVVKKNNKAVDTFISTDKLKTKRKKILLRAGVEPAT